LSADLLVFSQKLGDEQISDNKNLARPIFLRSETEDEKPSRSSRMLSRDCDGDIAGAIGKCVG
jgi:hypothetical protein